MSRTMPSSFVTIMLNSFETTSLRGRPYKFVYEFHNSKPKLFVMAKLYI